MNIQWIGKVIVIVITIFVPLYACSLTESVMSTHITDRIYQRMLRYEHHHENYKNSLLNNITPYGLQLKKKAQIETVSEDFSVKWTNVLYEEERKLVQLLLNKSQLMYNKIDKELNDTIRSAYPENSEEIKIEIIHRNLTFKITFYERRVKKWRKFKRKKRTIRSPKRSSKVSDFVEIALKRSQFQNVTDNRKYRQNLTKDKAENKKEILNSNTNTISIVGGTKLEDVRIDSDEKSDIENC